MAYARGDRITASGLNSWNARHTISHSASRYNTWEYEHNLYFMTYSIGYRPVIGTAYGRRSNNWLSSINLQLMRANGGLTTSMHSVNKPFGKAWSDTIDVKGGGQYYNRFRLRHDYGSHDVTVIMAQINCESGGRLEYHTYEYNSSDYSAKKSETPMKVTVDRLNNYRIGTNFA